MRPAEPINFIEARWLDGYRHVSKASSAVMLACERLVAELPASDDAAVLEVSTIELESGRRGSVGLLRFDVVVSTGSRRLRYVHAVVLPDRAALALDDWRHLVQRRYGEAPERAIRERYERAAVTEAAAGREVFAAFEIDHVDVGLVLGQAPPPNAPSSLPASPVAGGPRITGTQLVRPPTTAPPSARPPWLLLAALVLMIGAWMLGRSGRPRAAASTSDPSVATLRAQLDESHRAATVQTTALDGARVELQQCQVKLEQGAPGLAAQLDQANRDLSDVRDRAAEAAALVTRWKGEVTRLQQSLADANDSNSALTTRVAEKQRSLTQAQASLATVCRKVRGTRPAECSGL